MSRQTKLFGQPDEIKIISKLELAKAEILAQQIHDLIKPLCERIELVGSIRRHKKAVGDVDFALVVSDSNWCRIGTKFRKSNTICFGKQLLKVNYPLDGSNLFQADFYRATDKTFGIQKLIRTGSAEHNMFLANYAISHNMNLHYSQGLICNEKIIGGETEESVFSALSLPTPKPEEREIGNDGKPVWWIKNE